MIVCKLIGGLGNQLFQYAYACALAQQFGEDVCLDISFFNGKKPVIYKLNIKYRNEVENTNELRKARNSEKAYRVFQKVLRILRHEKIGQNFFNWCAEKGYYFNFDPFFYPSKDYGKENKYIYGYFQGEAYFKNVEESIRNQFTLIEKFGLNAIGYMKKIDSSSNAVAIHVRLGDYQKKKNQYMNVCTDAYYADAVKYIQEHVEMPQFFVFTNDVEKVKAKDYIPKDAVFVEDTADYEDLMLMQRCKHFIISNSSFSWWGSYLSKEKEKITVVPDIWMSTLREEPAIYRDDMVRIKTN